ncbi:hypothetical protein [Actinoplanes sp. NBRC 103695]|uniref:hypothetical protein n=1 Tax=Actinoplanes sp. NBRC 103695 TaxID=3032202 RepID=UPI002555B24F|nr:hypothetical protein [Actinoplanes sp. NBRC 103695]
MPGLRCDADLSGVERTQPMMRDELLERIAELPPDVDVGIRLGDDCLDIAGLETWGNGLFVALTCDENDLRDVFLGWRRPGPITDRPGLGGSF